MRVFVAGGSAELRETAIALVLDAARERKKITLLACSKACPVAGFLESWTWGKNILFGTLSAQTPAIFWEMVDSVIALPGSPAALLASAKEFNIPVWEPFKNANKPKSDPDADSPGSNVAE